MLAMLHAAWHMLRTLCVARDRSVARHRTLSSTAGAKSITVGASSGASPLQPYPPLNGNFSIHATYELRRSTKQRKQHATDEI